MTPETAVVCSWGRKRLFGKVSLRSQDQSGASGFWILDAGFRLLTRLV
jgi:hypothetical protein